MISSKNSQKGFTLIEVLLVVSMIAIVAGFSSVVYNHYQQSNQLTLSVEILSQALYTAQLNSKSAKNDSVWGVKIQSEDIVVFQGQDFETRDTSNDMIFDIPVVITKSGLEEIVFEKFSGDPQSTGEIFLSNSQKSETVRVNSFGLIEY